MSAKSDSAAAASGDEDMEAVVVEETNAHAHCEAHLLVAAPHFLRPTCCNVCGNLVHAVGKALQCVKCSAVCHESCRSELPHKLSCKMSACVPVPPATAPRLHHQWIPHNMHLIPDGWPPLTPAETSTSTSTTSTSSSNSATACVVCGHDTSSALTAQCHRARCMWCWRTTHWHGSTVSPLCAVSATEQACQMGPLACFIAPPNLVERDDHGEWVLRRAPADQLPPRYSPLVAFVNGKSGSQEGLVLARQLYRVLNPLQVFDLMEPGMPPGPARGLAFVREYGNDFTVLACGGDGTFGWVLEELRLRQLRPRVAVVPLGTGNDLARVLGWGGGFNCSSSNVASVLLAMANPNAVKQVAVDRWRVHAEPTTEATKAAAAAAGSPPVEGTPRQGTPSASPDTHAHEGATSAAVGVASASASTTASATADAPQEEEDKSSDGGDEEVEQGEEAKGVSEEEKERAKAEAAEKKGEAGPSERRMNNYWSIGLDAGVALSFHERRESNPAAFNSRMLNKVKYAGIGANQMLQADNHLSAFVELTVDGKRVPIPADVHCVVVLNLPSCYGGRNLWGTLAKRHIERGLKPISISDGMVEVLGIRNMMHIANINTGVSMPKKLAQGHTVQLRILSTDEQRACKIEGANIFEWYPCQFDGEPYKQATGQTITISHLEQAQMLRKL